MVISVGGWTQVLRFAYDTIKSNLTLSTTKILIVLDRDIQKDVSGFMKKEKIGFSNPPNYLPVKSLEKYLLEKLVNNVDIALFRELNDYIFQQKSLDNIIKKYDTDVKNHVHNDSEKIKNGKTLYNVLKHELEQIRKTVDDLVAIIVDYLFDSNNSEIDELTIFFEEMLGK